MGTFLNETKNISFFMENLFNLVKSRTIFNIIYSEHVSFFGCSYMFLTVPYLLFLVLDVSAFERLLGPCKEIMNRNIDKYEEELNALKELKISD